MSIIERNPSEPPFPETVGPAHDSWATVAPEGSPAPNVRLGDAPQAVTKTETGSTQGTGRYKILGEIARGGMGAVLKGHDSELNRDLALKVLLEKYRDNADILRRFFEEAQIGGQLQHPGIVPIYDLGVFPDKRPFFAMKLVKGRTLANLLKERKSSWDGLPRFVAIFEQVAQTVAFAHSKNVIHRDLKPQNIMVGAFGEVQVMDWGLAKVLTPEGQKPAAEPAEGTVMSLIRTARTDSGSDNSQTGSVLGTPAYMAPEQARGEIDRVDERADVFGLGSILCEILTGQPAYTGRTGAEIVRRAEFADLTEARGRLEVCGADTELIALAKSCLGNEPIDRPRDASEIAAKVTEHLASVQERLREAEIGQIKATARAETETARAETERAGRKFAVSVAAGIILALTVGSGSWFAYWFERRSRVAATDRIIDDELRHAENLSDAAKYAQYNNLDAWFRARAATEKVGEFLQHFGREDWPERKRLSDLSEKCDDHIKRAETLESLADQLDQTRLLTDQVGFSTEGQAQKIEEYKLAFREAKIDLEKFQLEMVGNDPGTQDARRRIAAAIADWAHVVGDGRQTLKLSIAKSIDPDPLNNLLREVLATDDLDAIKAFIAKNMPSINKERSLEEVPPASIVMLAVGLARNGVPEDATRLLLGAWDRNPKDFWINMHLGLLLLRGDSPRPNESLRFLICAVTSRPNDPSARIALGEAFRRLGQVEPAIAAFQEAIRLIPENGRKLENVESVPPRVYAEAHHGLGLVLFGLGRHAEAVTAYREAIRLKPNLAEPHCNLGHVLRSQARFTEALSELRKGHELGSERPGWPHPSAQWVAECEALLLAIEARIPGLLRGDDSAKNNADRLSLGQHFRDTKRFAASARFWGDALTNDPKLGADPKFGLRYNAACSATISGTGQGIDDPKPDDAARSKLRQQARDWLRAELSAWKQIAMTAEPGNKPLVAKTLQHWKADTDLAGVRDADAVAKLPEPERAEWRTLWDEVDSLLKKVAQP